MKHFAEMTLDELIADGGYDCTCGKHHSVDLHYVKIERDAVKYIPEALSKLGIKHPFIVFDPNTKKAAWWKVQPILDEAGIPYTTFCITSKRPEPDEYTVGSICMHYDPKCDGIMGIGSGVVNDCCKVLAHTIGCPQMICGTAPSMDGYASNSSSMIVERVKTTLYNACPGAIIVDTLIAKDAPERMLQAGLGDMLAKYCALAEWRISHLVTGEYYCEEIAELMRESLRRITAGASRLLERDPEVIGNIVEGLVLSGIAMSYATVSRPASGLEHYFSHMWEMMALSRGIGADLHGIQVGVGTYLALAILERIRNLKPDRAVADNAMAEFDNEKWEAEMKRVFDQTAPLLIDTEHNTWHKNDMKRHAKRLDNIINHWDEIQKILDEELPDYDKTVDIMKKAGLPLLPEELGINEQDTHDAFIMSREIRDKYLASSLLWDLGLLYSFPVFEEK